MKQHRSRRRRVWRWLGKDYGGKPILVAMRDRPFVKFASLPSGQESEYRDIMRRTRLRAVTAS